MPTVTRGGKQMSGAFLQVYLAGLRFYVSAVYDSESSVAGYELGTPPNNLAGVDIAEPDAVQQHSAAGYMLRGNDV